MLLNRSSPRSHGFGEGWGLIYDGEKNKWRYDKEKGAIGHRHQPAGEREFYNHYNGKTALGLGYILDDGTTYCGAIDIDIYDLNALEVIHKIKEHKLPLIPTKSKSGGLHLEVGFSEPVSAKRLREVLNYWVALLGYRGKGEIFPGQDQLLDREKQDFALWIFLPYGPTFDKLNEQCALNESGGALTLWEYMELRERMLLSKAALEEISITEQSHARRNSGIKKHNGGLWVEGETYEETVKSTFCDGPPCLYIIANNHCTNYQNNFLLDCSTFLRKKYSQNWQEALKWVNSHVLRPQGDYDRCLQLTRKAKEYEYMCKTEPICSFCDPHACRKMPFGVGQDGDAGLWDNMGMIVINKEPRTFKLSIGDKRFEVSAEDLIGVRSFKIKCLAFGAPFPRKSQKEWEDIIQDGLNKATYIDPQEFQVTNVEQLEMLSEFIGSYVPNLIRRLGERALKGDASPTDYVRIKNDRFWFKKETLWKFMRMRANVPSSDIRAMRAFLEVKAEWHNREDTLGGWWRSTWSMPFYLFVDADKWLGKEPGEKVDEDNVVKFSQWKKERDDE
jgi:hypothetical protein